MNKTININISGIVFHIDEDAYEKLENYLSSLRTHFAHSEGKEEIIGDIESRIAEILSEKMNERNAEVVIDSDVDEIISIMGNPEQFEDEDYEEETTTMSNRKRGTYKKLYRDPRERILGGVCAGLSHYLRVDTIWVRLIVFLSFFVTGGFTLLLYGIFWAILPKAQTTADILQMQGEAVNVTNIEKKISNQIGEVREGIESGRARKGVEGFLSGFFRVLGELVRGFLKVLWWVIKIVLVIWLVSLLIGLIAGFISLIIGLFTTLPVASTFFFSPSWLGGLSGILSLLFLGIPIAAILLFLARKIFKTKPLHNNYKWAMLGLWLLGGIGLLIIAASQIKQFSVEDEVVSTQAVNVYDSDTLYLKAADFKVDPSFEELPWINWDNDARFGKKRLYFEKILLDVEKSKNDQIALIKKVSARGTTRQRAFERASAIQYDAVVSGNEVAFSPYLEIVKPDKWRYQEVDLTLELPEGKTVYLDESMREIIYDIKNVTNTHDRNMLGRYWTMTEEGLECIDCADISSLHTSSAVRHGKDYDFANFNQLEISGIYEVEIRQDDEYRVSVSASDDLFFKTQLSQEGEKLIVKTARDGLTWNEVFRNYRQPKLYITLPELNDLHVEGLAEIELRDLDAGAMNIELDGASKLRGEIDVELLDLAVRGAAKIDVEGTSDDINLLVEGVARVDLYELLSNNAKVNIEGGGRAFLNVMDNLDVTLKGVSELSYKGEPEVISDIDGISSLRNY